MNSQAKLDMLAKIKNKNGFIAALDQSGGSTPKALAAYGIDSSEYHDDAKMFAKVHEMRTRIITSPFFDGDRTLGAILFENTLDREIEGQATAKYLWNVTNVVPFLTVAQGLLPEENGVQLMKPIANLDALLAKANAQNVFGTKMKTLQNSKCFGADFVSRTSKKSKALGVFFLSSTIFLFRNVHRHFQQSQYHHRPKFRLLKSSRIRKSS